MEHRSSNAAPWSRLGEESPAGSQVVHPSYTLRLTIVPCELDEANAFVAEHHRHHKPIKRDRFRMAVATDDGVVHGVAISALYAASWRAAKALGYRRCGTYILKSESGASLVAAGWVLIGERGGGSWDRKSRPRVDTHPLERKLLWEAV